MVIVRCVIPVNRVFKTGLVEVKLSIDGGKNYPWWTKFYICEYKILLLLYICNQKKIKQIFENLSTTRTRA